MGMFKIHWQHNYKGEVTNQVLFKVFSPLLELGLSAEEAAAGYAKSLSSGIYSVRYLGECE